MRAAVCREFGSELVIEDVQVGAPEGNEVTVDLAACAICHSDVAFLDGAWGGPLPTVFGHEAAGTVSAVGEGVSSVSPGDRVAVTLVRSCGQCFYCRADLETMCETSFRLDTEQILFGSDGEHINQGLRTGGFGEQVLVHESQLARVPDDVPMAAAALLACGVVTGFGAVTKTAAVPAGSAIAVVGTGGVGLNCIQGGVFAGAAHVIAVDLLDGKLDSAIATGATAAVNAAKEDAAAAVRAITAGRGADFVFVTAGTAAAIESAMPLLRRAGTLVVVGMPPTGELAAIDTGDLAHQGQRIIGSKMGSVKVSEDIAMLASLYEEGRLKLDELISGTYPLDEINKAVDSARSGAAVRNVVTFER